MVSQRVKKSLSIDTFLHFPVSWRLLLLEGPRAIDGEARDRSIILRSHSAECTDRNIWNIFGYTSPSQFVRVSVCLKFTAQTQQRVKEKRARKGGRFKALRRRIEPLPRRRPPYWRTAAQRALDVASSLSRGKFAGLFVARIKISQVVD